MKLLLISSICLTAMQTLGQNMKFTVGEATDVPVTKMPAAESISDDVFDLMAYIPCTDVQQEEIWNDFTGLQTTVMINGKTVETKGFSELYFSYSFQEEDKSEFLMTPSIQIEIPLKALIFSNATVVKANGNKLSITSSFGETVVASGEFMFDVPQFGVPNGDFCELKPNYLDGEQALIGAITKAFKSDHENAPIIKVWLPYTWMDLEDGSSETTGMVLFGTTENYATVPYKVSKNGTDLNVKVDENWLREYIHPDCVKAFLSGQ